MTRRFLSVLVVGSVVIVTVAAVAPALVSGHGSGRPSQARPALPSWAASLASKMFGPITPARRPGQVPTVTVPLPRFQGTTCYARGGSVCSNPACTRYAGAQSAVYQLNGAVLGAPSCARPAKPLVPKVVPIRIP